jgi:lipopolysaccharide export system protein LptC
MELEGQADTARYRAAMRHSGRVRFLRRAIPIGALLVVAGIAFLALVEPFRTLPAGLSVGPLSINGTKVTMELPKLTGFKKDNRPYEVNARWASQDVKNPTIIELRDIKARIAMQDKGMATVEAVSGIYNTNTETIVLRDDVRVKTEAGYDARLKSATIEFKTGSVVSTEPVTVVFGGGTIDSDAVEMQDNGARAVFIGRVRTIMKPEIGRDAPARKEATP